MFKSLSNSVNNDNNLKMMIKVNIDYEQSARNTSKHFNSIMSFNPHNIDNPRYYLSRR